MPGKLSEYHAKRNFGITPEPQGQIAAPADRPRFVVQRHDARKLHYDFRLEIDGTLKSWAVPKGPSLDPADKRLAVHVEDHPLDYIDFEGDIPAHQYGAGHVDVWDTGYWEPQGDPVQGYRAGKLKFRLDGEKLHGGWTLIRTRLPGGSAKEQWLLIKERDEEARPQEDIGLTRDAPEPSAAGKPRRKSAAPAPSRTRASRADKATKRPLPDMLTPQLATLVEEPPTDAGWMYEIKYDGYRVLARIDDGEVRLFTRDGKDWTGRLPAQTAALAALSVDTAWLDGEIVVLDKAGIPSFQLLQNAFDEKRAAQILFFVFDLPYLNGVDLRPAPLSERRALLEQLLGNEDSGPVRLSARIEQPAARLLDSACELAMEGIIGKRMDSPYIGKRSPDWIKLKCRRRQEFVVAGYTDPQGSRTFLGSLLLGVHDDAGRLHYAGRVGTGFTRASLREVHHRLAALAQDGNPFGRLPPGVARGHAHWVAPRLVVEVSFAEWTHDGRVRQAAFHGLRLDKPASQVKRETAVSLPQNGRQAAGAARPARQDSDSLAGIRITHPRRVIDRVSGLTKFDIALHYESVAARILPYLDNRPVYLLRVPDTIEGQRFFQKHQNRMPIPSVRSLDPALDPGHAPLMAIESLPALIGAAQMGAVELHICNAAADRMDRPDCMMFDLDPDPTLPWTSLVEAARLTRVMLDELGLRSFLKTSGGRGLHLAVPLARRHDWDTVAAFSDAIARHLARTLPDKFSAKMGEHNRVGKIYVDTVRNRRMASTVAPYSVRARPGLPVSTPIDWEELDDIAGAAMWTVATLPERLAGLREDPWRDFFTSRQMLTARMRSMLDMTG